MSLKKVTESITLTSTDTDASIMDKISERIGRKIVGVQWAGVSGLGARGYVVLAAKNSGTEKVPFRARAKRGIGGVFKVGNWIVPYLEPSSDIEILHNRIDNWLSERGGR